MQGNDPSQSFDEFALIDWIRSRTSDAPNVPVGPGDDCAVLRLPDGTAALLTTDMLIDGVHFRRSDAVPERIGHKAIARAVSDIAAMAGRPLAAVVAMAAPRGLPAEDCRRLFTGMQNAARALGLCIAGGDIATGDLPLTLTVMAIGSVEPGRAILRSGAQPGDCLMVTGALGGASLGRHLDFLPRVSEALWLRDHADLHAMIDISDGLAADAGHLAGESGCAVEIEAAAVPVSDAARTLAAGGGAGALERALADGEDYELLFTVSPKDADRLVRSPKAPVRLSRIGRVFSGSGLTLRSADGATQPLDPKGWVHRL